MLCWWLKPLHQGYRSGFPSEASGPATGTRGDAAQAPVRCGADRPTDPGTPACAVPRRAPAVTMHLPGHVGAGGQPPLRRTAGIVGTPLPLTPATASGSHGGKGLFLPGRTRLCLRERPTGSGAGWLAAGSIPTRGRAQCLPRAPRAGSTTPSPGELAPGTVRQPGRAGVRGLGAAGPTCGRLPRVAQARSRTGTGWKPAAFVLPSSEQRLHAGSPWARRLVPRAVLSRSAAVTGVYLDTRVGPVAHVEPRGFLRGRRSLSGPAFLPSRGVFVVQPGRRSCGSCGDRRANVPLAAGHGTFKGGAPKNVEWPEPVV